MTRPSNWSSKPFIVTVKSMIEVRGGDLGACTKDWVVCGDVEAEARHHVHLFVAHLDLWREWEMTRFIIWIFRKKQLTLDNSNTRYLELSLTRTNICIPLTDNPAKKTLDNSNYFNDHVNYCKSTYAREEIILKHSSYCMYTNTMRDTNLQRFPRFYEILFQYIVEGWVEFFSHVFQ